MQSVKYITAGLGDCGFKSMTYTKDGSLLDTWVGLRCLPTKQSLSLAVQQLTAPLSDELNMESMFYVGWLMGL